MYMYIYIYIHTHTQTHIFFGELSQRKADLARLQLCNFQMIHNLIN